VKYPEAPWFLFDVFFFLSQRIGFSDHYPLKDGKFETHHADSGAMRTAPFKKLPPLLPMSLGSLGPG